MASVLVVDDSPVNRRFLATLLTHHGHMVIEASDAAELIASAKAEPPDVIVADLLMPVMDGYEMLKRLRADPQTKEVPVVIFTAHYGGRPLALANGAAWFLTNAESNELPVIVERVLAGERQPVSGDAQ